MNILNQVRSSRALLWCLALLVVAVPAFAQQARRINAVPAEAVVALTASPTAIYAATYTQVYASPDKGATWNVASALPTGTDPINALFVQGTTLYLGTLGSGVFTSTDGGATWSSQSSGLGGLSRRVSAFTVRGDSLFAGTDAGIYVLNLQQPAEWQSFNEGFAGASVRALSVTDRTLVASGGISGQVMVQASGLNPAWRAVALGQQPLPIAQAFLRSGPFVIAGTTDGFYRSPRHAEGWQIVHTSFPAGTDVLALASIGARAYAIVQNQGFQLLSSDDHGAFWTHRSTVSVPVYALLGGTNQLWLGQDDGLWVYDLASTTPMYQATLFEDVFDWPTQRGGTLATLDDDQLVLSIHYTALPSGWSSVDLYDGAPEAGGTLIENLNLGVTNDLRSGGVMGRVTLTHDQRSALDAGQLFLVLRMFNGTRLSAPIQSLPMVQPRLITSDLTHTWQGVPVIRGRILGALEGNRLRLTWHVALDHSWTRVDLYRGFPGEEGTLVSNLLLYFGTSPQYSLGADDVSILDEALIADLLEGRLYVRVETTQPDAVIRGNLLASLQNQPPAATSVASPADGQAFTLGGIGGNGSVDPATPLTTVSITPSTDPDGNQLTYAWQVSRVPSFAIGSTVTIEFGLDQFDLPITVGDLADIFDATWGTEPIPFETATDLYHRAIVSDGVAFTVGSTSRLSVVRGAITNLDPDTDLPTRFALQGNYPNPFNPSTAVVFDLPAPAEVTIDVFNLLGQRVLTFSPGQMQAGSARRVDIDAGGLASGTYLYRVMARTGTQLQVEAGTLTLLK